MPAQKNNVITKNREKKEENLTEKIIFRRKAHTNTWKFKLNILIITDVFLDHREHTVKTALRESFGKVPPVEVGDRKGGGVGGMGRKLNGNHLKLIPGLCPEDRMNR